MYQYQIYWQQIILGHDLHVLSFVPVRKTAYFWGRLYGVWGCLGVSGQCLDGVLWCLAYVLIAYMSEKLNTVE